MKFNYGKLKGKIREVCGSQEAFASDITVSGASLSKKLNNHTQFTPSEIMKSIEVLNLKPEEVHTYFFALEVQKTEQKEG